MELKKNYLGNKIKDLGEAYDIGTSLLIFSPVNTI